ncbi:MAG: glucose-1-phosphate adenylyltransferase subunit GlgD [Lachnospiraceae bacterium]|nr:glucose-1-phosphate adenylyltransferase subunit GlgD [Lachnospiraceae bacterium]
MKAIGIVLAGGNNKRMRELSRKRAIAAMPMAGSYRAIDFALSSLSASRVKRVAVLTQYNSRSLNEHLSSSKWWDFGRKQGGLYLFPPTITAESSDWYRGTADSLYQNLDFIRESHEPYVIICSGDGIYKLDFNEVLAYHVDKGADITVVCKEMPEGTDVSRFGVVKTDENDRILQIEEKPVQADGRLVSCGIYVIRRRLLIELIEKCAEEDRYDFVSDILIRYRTVKNICAYRMKSYWNSISTVDAYYRTNMDFLDPEVRRHFFKTNPEVFSRVFDNPPTKYNPGSVVRDSLLASGCIINGTVEHSVLFKKCYIGNGSVIKNSILLDDVYIGDGVYLENCIVDGHSTVRAGEHIVGQPDNIRVVAAEDPRI